MNTIKIKLALLFLVSSITGYAQLGFCTGSKGEPLFRETFGNGMTYGPALPGGTTTYAYINGAPHDGQYTLFYHSSMFTTWHYSLDHTPDATDGPNGKMLLMNAHAVTSGDFYKKTVTGLCINTTFEFSAWLMNVYNPNTNYCGAGQIPINVRFEIWNDTETVLLGSGNTGNIMGSPTPLWQQFALVFTTTNETTVVLKMKNNGLGGCGNDLAIDDIEFRACGDLTTVSSPSVVGATYNTCTSPVSLQLNAATASTVPYFYQWQSSTDGTSWTDIPGATNATYTTPNLTTTTYYRAKAAQDAANLTGTLCSSFSNVFTVSFAQVPLPATSDGDQTVCSGDPIPALSVTAGASTGVNWYSASTGGTLLQSNSTSFTPTAAGTYYAETFNTTSNCINPNRTPVMLTIIPQPDATISGTTSICSGNTATISFSGTPNAIVTYTVDGGAAQSVTLNGSGTASITTPVLTANTTYTMTNVESAAMATCARTKNDTATITVNNTATATISGTTQICSGSPATISISGTPNATVTYSVNGGANQTVTLSATGDASFALASVTSNTTYTLVDVSFGGLCSQSLSQSATVTVISQPTASIAANPPSICSDQSSTITITGTPNAIVTYTLNGGANQNATLSASGWAVLTTATGLSANQTYALVNVVSGSSASCSATLTGSATVTVNQIATATISVTPQVCSGSSATVSFTGTPNADVTYTVDGGPSQSITLSASGGASVIRPNVTTTTVYALTGVSLGGLCPQTLSQSLTISAVPMPTASLSASASVVCAGQTATVTFTGTPNAIIGYTTNGGPVQNITLNGSGTATLTTSALSVTSTYALVNATSAILTSCSASLSASTAITVNPLPTASIATNAPVCSGSAATVTFTGTPNATVTYSAGGTNQTILLNSSGSASVTIPSVTSSSVFTLVDVTSGGPNPCSQALSQSVTVSAVALPTASIVANPSTVCSGQSSMIGFTGTANAVVTYQINGGTNQTVTLDASGVTSVSTNALSAGATYQLVSIALPGTDCGQALSGSASVSINPTPTATYSGNLTYCNGDTIGISLSSATAGTTFSWTVSENGTTGASAGTGNQISQTIGLSSAAAGTVIYTVTPTSNGCTGNPILITLTIHPLPVPQIADGVICTTGTGSTHGQPYLVDTNLNAAGHTFQWFFGGNPIPGATGSTYSATQVGTYSVIATNGAGCSSAMVTATVTEMPQGESLTVQQSAAFSDNQVITVTVVGGGGPFLYQLNDGPMQPSNVFHDVPNGLHTITVTDGYCTFLTSAVRVIRYPKFFTPNGDGIHDTWNIDGVDGLIYIFDRYGKLIKQIGTNGVGWDGTFNGSNLPSTDYWFAIDYLENGESKTFRGHFALKR